MNPTELSELLDRAAASVTPAETDPVSRMVSLGRRSVRRRRIWGAAVAVVVAVALPLAWVAPHRSAPVETTVSFAGLSVVVPPGWPTRNVTTFDPCTAKPHTVYLASKWTQGISCRLADQAWIAVLRQGVAPLVNPGRLVVRGGHLLQAEQVDEHRNPFLWAYRAFTDEILAPTVFILGHDQKLLERVTWPAGPPGPASGGLALPARITSATSAAPPSNGMVVATDAKTLNQIRGKLAGLHDRVPTGQECTLEVPGAVGISLGEVTVVMGDATCPQAISTGGGRVRVPPHLGRELLDLIVASDRAASRKGG